VTGGQAVKATGRGGVDDDAADDGVQGARGRPLGAAALWPVPPPHRQGPGPPAVSLLFHLACLLCPCRLSI
jgi:hypothetical protein